MNAAKMGACRDQMWAALREKRAQLQRIHGAIEAGVPHGKSTHMREVALRPDDMGLLLQCAEVCLADLICRDAEFEAEMGQTYHDPDARRGEGRSLARSHKPGFAGSTPAPAPDPPRTDSELEDAGAWIALIELACRAVRRILRRRHTG